MANKTICALTYGDTHVFTLPYGTCSTAAATAAKTVAVQDGKFSLETGARVAIKFTVTNTAANPTLNVSGTGAKAIMYRGSAINKSYLAANRVYDFIYDGTDWELIGDIDTNSTGYLPLSGGTLTGNLTGQYLTGTWLQTTAATDLGSAATKIPVLDSAGWLYYRTANELRSDIGAASKTELNEVKTSVSEGKALIAAAVTGKGVSTAADATF